MWVMIWQLSPSLHFQKKIPHESFSDWFLTCKWKFWNKMRNISHRGNGPIWLKPYHLWITAVLIWICGLLKGYCFCPFIFGIVGMLYFLEENSALKMRTPWMFTDILTTQLLHLWLRNHCRRNGKIYKLEEKEICCKMCLLEKSEATPMKSHHQGFQNMTWTRIVPIDTPTLMDESSWGLKHT